MNRESLPGFLRRDSSPSIEERAVITDMQLGVEWKDMETFLRWMDNPRVKGHLDPLPRMPDWKNPQDVDATKLALYDYYRNLDPESKKYEPDNVQPITARNKFGEPIGVLTIRWRGDKYVPKDQRIASIERLVVDPNLAGRGIGTQLVARAAEYAFNEHKGYRNGQGAVEVRAWVMTDKTAQGYETNINLMHRLGFRILQSDRSAWSRYAKMIGYETDREGYCYKLDKKDWSERHIATP